MPLESGAVVGIFSGNRVHVEGPGSGPVSVVGSADSQAPAESQVAFMVKQLVAHRVRIEHSGWNPFPWIRSFRPTSQEDAIALMGLAQNLMDPELSPTDLENIARDVLREGKLAKYFMYL